MTDEETASMPRHDPRDEAIRWWLRGRDGPLSPEDQAAFELWLARDRANKAAFDDISGMATHFMQMRPRPAPKPMHGSRQIWLGSAAAIGAASVALFMFFGHLPLVLQSDYYAGTGETKRVMLTDGSQIALNAQSAIAVHVQGRERRLTLLEGEAWFQVAPDPARPFIVEAAGGTVTALGTAFDVSLDRGAAHVTVTEHRVSVESGATKVTVEEGQQTSYGGHFAPQQPSPANPARAIAWQRGKLIFENTPLAEVIEAISRYHQGYIFLTNSALRARRVTAVFGTDDPIQAIGEIEIALGLHATYLTRYFIFLHE